MAISDAYATQPVTARVAQTNDLHATAGARIRSNEPDYDSISSAIRAFLRHEYAEHLYGTEDTIPTRLSAFSGKGLGSYQTADDGRADWSPDFKKWIFDRTSTPETRKSIRFSMTQFHVAMQSLERDHPRWHVATMLYDVKCIPIADVATKLRVHNATIHRYRKSTAHYLYRVLLGVERPRDHRIVAIFRPIITA